MKEKQAYNKQHASSGSASIGRKILKIFLRSLLVVLSLAALLIVLVYIPPVQQFIRKKAVSYLSEKLDTRVELGLIRIGWPADIMLENIYVEDRQKDTLLAAASIKADISLMRLFKSELQFERIELSGITGEIKRVMPDTLYNFQFIIDAFASETPEPASADSSTFKISAKRIALDNIRFAYKDVVTGNDMTIALHHFDTEFRDFDLDKMLFEAPIIRLKGLTADIYQQQPLADSLSAQTTPDISDPANPGHSLKNAGAYHNDVAKQNNTETSASIPFNLRFDKLHLNDIRLNYDSKPDAFFTHLDLGELFVQAEDIDLPQQLVSLNELRLENTNAYVRMGKQTAAKNKTASAPDSNTGSNETDSAKASDWKVYVKNIELKNNDIAFNDENQPAKTTGIDYAHLGVSGLLLNADHFTFTPDSIGVFISQAQFTEKSGLQLKALEAELLYASHKTYLRGLSLETADSRIQTSLDLLYPSIEAVQKDIGALQLHLNLQETRLKLKDILQFAPMLAQQPAFADPEAIWTIEAKADGSLSRLSVDQLTLAALSGTKLDIEGLISGLPEVQKLSGNLVIHDFQTNRRDIESLIPKGALPATIGLPQNLGLRGSLSGSALHAIANLTLSSSLGNISLNGQINHADDKQRAAYAARVGIHQLQLNKLLKNDSLLGPVTATFSASGKGFDPEKANARLEGNIVSAVLNRYTYQDIAIRGSLEAQQAGFSLSIDDPHIQLAFDGSGDISTDFPSIRLNGSIDKLETLPLHLTTDTISYRGHITANFPVTDPDRPEGTLYITGSALSLNGKQYAPDTISLIAGGSDTGRFIRFYSDVLDAEIAGQYQLTKLGSVFTQAIEPYFSLNPAAGPTSGDQRNENRETDLPVKAQQDPLANAMASDSTQKSPVITKKNAPGASTVSANPNDATTTTGAPDSLGDYNFSVKANLVGGPLLGLFAPDLELSEPVRISAHFDNDNWQAMANAPLVKMGENSIHAFALNAGTTGNAIRLETGLDAFSSGSFQLYKTSISGDIAGNKINLLLNITDKNQKDKYRLGAELAHPSQGEYTLSLRSDSLMLNYDPWTVDPGNRIRFDQGGLNIHQFALQKSGQQLLLNSASAESNAPLEIRFDQFRIATITAIAAQDSLLADGAINGGIVIRDLAQQPHFTGDLTINELSFKQDTVGNLALKVNNAQSNVFHADIALSGKGNDVELSGDYHLKPNNQSVFDLALDIRKLQMSSLEAFSMGAITQAAGYIDGRVDIKGSVDQPDINGKLQFNQTRFSPAMLGSLFSIDQESITVNKEGIRFDNFTVRDSANNALNINGSAYTTNFINYRFDMDVLAENFQALNSIKRRDQLFYGQFYFDTDLHIGGTEAKPVIDGDLKVNERTRLTIVLPQESPGIVEREGVIRFVRAADSLVIDSTVSAADSTAMSDLRGMDVSVNIEVDKKAELTLIVDEANGDFLRMKGTAQLNGGIDPSGKTTLTGTYEIEEGAYELSFNFLKRKFNIRKGGKITWLGEPTRANIDLTAVYTAETAPLSLVENQIDVPNINIYKQRLPFEVNLLLSGELLKPEIKFDVALPSEKNFHVDASVIDNVETRLTQLRSEPSELNKQVFALLLLNRFVSENPFAGGGGMSAESAVRESVSRILSDQLNNLAADLIRGVDLNFDLESTDDYTTGKMENRTDLNVSLSKSLLNDRLRVTVGSNFEIEGPQRGNQKANNLAGNVALDYLLSKDGRYMLRAYRKNNYEGQLDGYIIETGLNFIITLDYNRLREIFHLPQQSQRRTIKENRSDKEPGTDTNPGPGTSDANNTRHINNSRSEDHPDTNAKKSIEEKKNANTSNTKEDKDSAE